MPLKSQENVLGARAFLIGVILAVVIGTIIGLSTSKLISLELSREQLNTYSSAAYAILVILGVIIGFMNETGRDSQTFLIAGAILVIISGFGIDSVRGTLIGIGVGDIASSIFGALSALFAPATIVVALKTVFSISKI